ncbi:MAG TPA: VTT domain-containing protein [Candidatus Micrarchaeaceae archaeon]|nr:VTT domain-containing protein [Candidatus Micrarchaeaceae archaeon]
MFPQLSGVAIVLTLLFLEEAGLPLPVAPGEAVLIGAGLLVASGAAPVWVMAPLAYLAVVCGVVTGYAWAHRIGPTRVHALATRFHAGGPYVRAVARLRAATPLEIAISRLLPGLRVYTSLVAGAANVNFGRFMAGVLPASAVWVVTFMGLGLFVGAPVERLLGRFEAYGLRALVVAVVVVVWVMAARLMPAGDRPQTAEPRRRKRRLAGAFTLDLLAVSSMTGALSLMAGLAPVDVAERAAVAAIAAVLGVTYLFVARQTVGYTVGEALLDVRYYAPRRPHLRRTG